MSKYSYCSTLTYGCPVYNDIKRTSPYTSGYLSAVVSGVNYYYRTDQAGIIGEIGVCPSEDFTQYATVDGGYLKKSNDSGLSWFNSFASAGTSDWKKVDVSQGGQYVFVIDSHYVLRSANYGSEFSFEGVKFNLGVTYTDIAVSRSGQYVILVEDTGYIWTSSDYGINWTARTAAGSRQWKKCSISGNGQYMLASAGNHHNRLYRSGDYGVTWGPVSDTYYYWDSAISDTGQYQIAIRNSGYIYPYSSYVAISNNYGLTWSNETSGTSGYYVSVDISGTGQYTFATTTTNAMAVKRNANYGLAGYWSSVSILTNVGDINSIDLSSSSSGKTVLVSYPENINNGYLFISRDYGASFTRIDGFDSAGEQNWASVVIAPTSISGGGGPSCPAANIYIDQYCSGYDLIYEYTDGDCGIYGVVQEYNSFTCGYNAGENNYCDCGFGCEQFPNPCYYYGCNECLI